MNRKQYVEVSWSATLHIGGTKLLLLDEDMKEYIADVADEDFEDIDPKDLAGYVSDMGERWMEPSAVHPVMDWVDEAIENLSWSDAEYEEISTRLVGHKEGI